jgi:hypothetical protein
MMLVVSLEETAFIATASGNNKRKLGSSSQVPDIFARFQPNLEYLDRSS